MTPLSPSIRVSLASRSDKGTEAWVISEETYECRKWSPGEGLHTMRPLSTRSPWAFPDPRRIQDPSTTNRIEGL